MKPVIFDPQKESLADFSGRFPLVGTIDRYAEQLREIFLIRNPRYRFQPDYEKECAEFTQTHLNGKSLQEMGSWFYFPWSKLLVHYLPDALHQELRTARNKNLITAEEQARFYDFTVGIAGLSVGSHAALTLAMMGGSRIMKLADPDEISGSNLNRIRTDFSNVGVNKCDAVVHQIYQMNPYAHIYEYPQGVNTDGIDEFLGGSQRIGVLVECLDDPELKILLRIEARKRGIPVIMATDNGDGIIFDVERYDTEPNLKLFNGVIGDLTLEEFQKFAPQELPRLATKIAGPDIVVPRMLESVSEVGKSLYSWPQLGDAATLAGVAIAYAVKRLALGQSLRTGKFEVNLDSIFDPDYSSPEAVQDRNEQRKKFLQKIGFE